MVDALHITSKTQKNVKYGNRNRHEIVKAC